MRKLILIAGTAIVLTASPALAGGPLGGGLLGGLTGNAGGQSASDRTAGTLGDCLCNTANSVLSRSHPGGGAIRVPAGTAGNATLVNSVVGLNAGRLGGASHGNGRAIDLAGTVSGTARSPAASVTAPPPGTA